MKTQDLKALQTKTNEELKKMLHEAREALFSLRMEHQQMRLKNTRSLSGKRREIAQIMTALSGKEST